MIATPITEIPLAIFSTLIPLGAGGFIALFVALFTENLAKVKLELLDKMTLIPAGAVLIGLAASFFHLSAPLNAISVFSGIGRSPLSTEILVCLMLVAALIIYFCVIFSGKATTLFRKVTLAMVIVLGGCASAFIGLAYYVNTIPGWALPWTIFELIGMNLTGALFGSFALSAANAYENPRTRATVFLVSFVGLAIVFVSLISHIGAVSQMSSMVASGATLASESIPYASVGLVIEVIAIAVCAASIKWPTPLTCISGPIMILAGSFFIRLAFYCLQFGVGI